MARAKKCAATIGFTKSDLKTGMVVEYRNGKRRLVINDWEGEGTILYGNTGERFTHLANFNDDLTHPKKDALDIVAVYLHDLSRCYCDVSVTDDLIWERSAPAPAPVEMTVADVCDALGFTVKIVR